ncbi:hypothetical protein [Paraburkholderia lacunae]|uniref:Uncharacterized protein n=1 Tax=Paraburkholderia lacunae TaxID=2211104 RepID=A0A370N7M9_9BURK|nr:hypothetical protein [Paraburkholderia lacunae]RDK01627.1 hypothetical protein DLM46_17655 [Paraburkholderia lacunae]
MAKPLDMANEFELATDAHEDLTCLVGVFGWLNELFASIDDCASDREMIPGAALLRIHRLAELGSNVSTNWMGTAESMADKFAIELNKQGYAS